MFFHPDEIDGVTKQRALSIFKLLFEVDRDDEPMAAGRDQYLSKVKSVQIFTLAVNLIDLGDSFLRISRQLQEIREQSGIYEYGGSFESTILK